MENFSDIEVKKGKDKVKIEDIGRKYNIYNGKIYNLVSIKDKMVGRFFGEFIFTRVKSVGKKKKGGK